MSKDNTTSENNTPRRDFLKQSAGMAGAVMLGSSLLHAQTAATDNTLSEAELEIAAEGIGSSGNPLLTVLVLEHVETLAKQGRTQDIERVVAVVRRHSTTGSLALHKADRLAQTPAQTLIDRARADLKAEALSN